MLRMIDPKARDSSDHEAYIRNKLSKESWRRERRARRFRGPAYELQTGFAPPVIGSELVGHKGGLLPPSGMGATSPPNLGGAPVHGGFFSALLPFLPGLIGGVVSAIPGIIAMFKKPKSGTGAIAPPNLHRGGLAPEALQAIIPMARRIEQDVAGAHSGAEFFHRLASGLQQELPPLLHRYSKVAPTHVEFLVNRVMKRMGLPPSFVDFVAEEAGRIGSKGAEFADRKFQERFSGRGAMGGEVDGGAALAELIRPILKYVASKALHKIGPARALYKKAKEIMGSAQSVYDFTEDSPSTAGPATGHGGAPIGKSPAFAASIERTLPSDRGAIVAQEDYDDEVIKKLPKKKGLFGRIGQMARKVLGTTLEKIAPAGAKALGLAIDAASNRVLGTQSTLGRDVAESLGESALSTVGKMIQPEFDRPDSDEEEDEEDDDEDIATGKRYPPPPVKQRPKKTTKGATKKKSATTRRKKTATPIPPAVPPPPEDPRAYVRRRSGGQKKSPAAPRSRGGAKVLIRVL